MIMNRILTENKVAKFHALFCDKHPKNSVIHKYTAFKYF